MSCHPDPAAALALPAPRRRADGPPARPAGGHGGSLAALSALAAAALVVVTAGLVEPPNVAGALADASGTLGAWTYPVVAGLAFLETGAFVGLVVPGETAVVLGGVVAARGGVDLATMLVLVWPAAALGDLTSFALGRRLGRSFLLAHGWRVAVTEPRMARVEVFFARHGPRAILFGRWIGLVRALLPFVAGASGMTWRAFVPWSLIGTAAWATTFTLVGFAFHHSFGAATEAVTHAALALAALLSAVLAWHAHRARRGAAASSASRPH